VGCQVRSVSKPLLADDLAARDFAICACPTSYGRLFGQLLSIRTTVEISEWSRCHTGNNAGTLVASH